MIIVNKYKNNRIMIVDDEEFCQTMMKQILFSMGVNVEHRVDCFINGQEALDQVKDAQSMEISYDLIFTDFSMPVMNGLESTRLIR